MTDLLRAKVGDDLVTTTDEIARAIADADDTTPIELTAIVWRPGFNRNAWTLTEEAVAKVAATGSKIPLLYDHDPKLIEGMVHRSWVEAGDILQKMALGAGYGRRLLALGIDPHFSVHLQPLENTERICTVCEEDARECEHFAGWMYDGVRAQVMYTDAEFSESSIEVNPAIPGTRLAASENDDIEKIRAVKAASIKGSMNMADKKPPEGKSGTNENVAAKTVPGADVQDLMAKVNALTQRNELLVAAMEMQKAENLLAESRSVATKAIELGQLRGEVEVIAKERANSPGRFDRWLALVPPNPAYAAGTVVTGTSTPPVLPTAKPQTPMEVLEAATKLAQKEDIALDKAWMKVRQAAGGAR